MIKKMLGHLFLEIRQGNMTAILLVAAGLYAVWVTFGQPLYDKLYVKSQTNYERTIELQNQVEDLLARLEDQKAENNKRVTKEVVEQSIAGPLEVEY